MVSQTALVRLGIDSRDSPSMFHEMSRIRSGFVFPSPSVPFCFGGSSFVAPSSLAVPSDGSLLVSPFSLADCFGASSSFVSWEQPTGK